MHIDWGSLGLVFGTSLVAVVVVSVVFGLGVLGLSRSDASRTAQSTGGGAFRITAGIAFAICALVAVFGVYLITVN
jgi:hypothetical protein